VRGQTVTLVVEVDEIDSMSTLDQVIKEISTHGRVTSVRVPDPDAMPEKQARYICKLCGAESPTGIGYVLAPGNDSMIRPTPWPKCPNPHKVT